jgi:predicted dehydrogenase
MIRIGIVGCGRILAAHLRGYRALRAAGFDNFRITALCARRREDAEMYVRRGSGPPQRPAVSNLPGDPLAIGDEYLSDFQPDTTVGVYTDYREMIASGTIDAVNDFSTHALHHQVAEAAFAQRKHLLTQKPLAVTVAAARKMCDQAGRAGVTFGVFENFRFAPRTRHLQWAFQSGVAGRLQMFLLGYAGVWWAPDLIVAETPWRHVKNEAGGISLDLGVHFFNQLRAVGGEIAIVSAKTKVLEPKRVTRDADGKVVREIECDADDTFAAHFETEAGAIGNLFASWGGHGGPTYTADGTTYYGSKARISGDRITFDSGETADLGELFAKQASQAERERCFPRGLTDSFALAQLDWLQSIERGTQPQTSGPEGLRDLATAFALLESDLAARPVRVEDVVSGRLRDFQKPLDARFGLA